MIKDILYTGTLTFFIMLLLHHIYNYLQSNLTIPKVNEIITRPIVLEQLQPPKKDKDELKEYLNQFKKK
jgi:hypothetical protein